MFNLLVCDVMEGDSALRLAPGLSVSDAATLMHAHQTGAVMVVDQGHLVGVFTERDALFRVIAAGRDPATTRLSEVMTPDPLTITPDRTYGYALLIMQENGFRHVPVLKEGRPVGMVSSRNAMDPDLEEFTSEANRRHHIRAGH